MDNLISHIHTQLAKSTQPKGHLIPPSSHFQNQEPQTTPLQQKQGTAWFIDGGSVILFESASLTLAFIRITAVLFNKKKCTKIIQKETHCLISPESDTYTITFFPEITPNTKITKKDRDTTTILNLIRRNLELELATQLQGITFIDGSLEHHHPEEPSLEKSNNKTIYGLSKTASFLFSEQGEYTSLILSPHSFIYTPFTSTTHYNIHIVKLHPQSDYLFRLDIPQTSTPKEIANLLVSFSTDSTFLGYPYPLIKADDLARITNEEAESQRTRITISLGKTGQQLLERLTSKKAHSILDSLKF
mgnify:CR=1|tara:strand:- start:1246 stop:2154 length:909 start_codon:yes stop_codon:yes gene_type:complete